MNIVIFSPSIYRSRFFFNVYNQLLKDYKVTFITSKNSAYKFLKSKKVDVINIKDIEEIELTNKQKTFFKKKIDKALVVDRKIGILNDEKLIKNYWFLVKRFINLFNKKRYDVFFIFNGNAQYIEYSAKLIGEYFQCKNIFFEIGNFPNKIFIDKKGVNITSSLIDIDLRQLHCDLEKFLEFKERYLIQKEKNHFVPQSKIKVDFLTKILDIDRFEPSLLIRTYNLFNNYLLKPKIKFDKLLHKEFLFFPLQVSYDSQVLRFSKISLFEAIDIASNDAKNNNLAFVVKPHPAELNPKVIEYAKNKGADIINKNTYFLLKNASKVYTINSTVGLESFFYNKPLVVLGEAFYKKYVNDSYENKLKVLCSYLNNILINGNYFDEKIVIEKKLLDYLK